MDRRITTQHSHSPIDVINVYNVYKKIFVNVFIILSTFISIKITSKTKQNYDGKPSYSALRSITDRVHWVTVLVTVKRTTQLSFHVYLRVLLCG